MTRYWLDILIKNNINEIDARRFWLLADLNLLRSGLCQKTPNSNHSSSKGEDSIASSLVSSTLTGSGFKINTPKGGKHKSRE